MLATHDPISPQAQIDPYPTYARLREEAPVHRSDEHGFWVLTRYDDVHRALRDHATFSSTLPGAPKALSMNAADPPEHTRLRSLVSRAFTPRMVEGLEPRVQSLVDQMLAEAGAGGALDVVQDLAYPLPMTILADLLGVPADMRDAFKFWTDDLGVSAGGEPTATHGRSMREFREYFAGVIEQRRVEPTTDLLGVLTRTADEEGDRLTHDEVLAFCLMMLAAGHETTTSIVGFAAHALLADRALYERVREDPSRIPALIEEAMRFYGPVQAVFRNTTADVEVRGRPIATGDRVMLVIASANRDVDHFGEDADRFDVDRTTLDHLALGTGIHHCIGAPLGKLQARVALATMLRTLPDLHLEGDAGYPRTVIRRPSAAAMQEATSGRPTRVISFVMRGYDRLPVRFSRS